MANQFTQQLVQFTQVEQQLKQNDQLATLVSLQKTAQSTAAPKDTSGQNISVPTGVEGLVNSADLTKNPPVLSVAGQDFTLDKAKRVVRH